MALSGNFISNTGVNLNLYITWSATQSVANNTSTITMNAYVRTWTLSVGTRTCNLTADGSTQSYTSPSISDSSESMTDWFIGTKTFTVNHNTDGTKSCGLSGTFPFNGTYSGQSISTITASTTVTLNTIPRTSIFSHPDSADIDASSVSFSITRYSTSFAHKLFFKYSGDTSYTEMAALGTSTTTYNWNLSSIATTLGGKIPTASSGVWDTKCVTYTDATYNTIVGSAYDTITLSIPTGHTPTASSITDTSPHKNAGYYQNLEDITIAFNTNSIAARYGSTLTAVQVYWNSTSYTCTTVSETSYTRTISKSLINVGPTANSYYVKLTDSRGNIYTSSTVRVAGLTYSFPTIEITNLERGNGTAPFVAALDGVLGRVTFTLSTPPSGVTITSVTVTGINGTTVPAGIPAFTTSPYIMNPTAAGDFLNSVTYQLRFTVTDSVGGTGFDDGTLLKVQKIISLNHYGDGIAIGKVSTQAGLEVDWAAQFNQGFTSPIIPANADLNNYTTSGFYKCTLNVTAATIINCPTSYAFSLLVEQHAGTKQILTEYFSDGTAECYWRNRYQTTWTAWARMALSILDIYPIGSIYLSTSSTNPGTIFGGTWAAWGQGRVPMGVGSIVANTDTSEGTVTAGAINKTSADVLGGKNTHTLTTTEMPSHTHVQDAHDHTVRYKSFAITSGSGWMVLRRTDAADSYDGTDTDAANAKTATNQNTGGGGAHNNMQPYVTCYMWKRTA